MGRAAPRVVTPDAAVDVEGVRQRLRDLEARLAHVEAVATPTTSTPTRTTAASETADGRAPQPPAGGRLELQVMAPVATATVDGRPVRLSSAQVKLVVGLVVEHPAPLHLDQASDLLWGDLPTTTTRRRLNALVYRLRGRLAGDGGPEGVVWRDGSLLGVDASCCDADLWRFRHDLAGSGPEQRLALVEVRGLVCDAQFLYDEHFVDERRRLAGLWLDRARALVGSGDVTPFDLRPALAALRLAEDDVVSRPGLAGPARAGEAGAASATPASGPGGS